MSTASRIVDNAPEESNEEEIILDQETNNLEEENRNVPDKFKNEDGTVNWDKLSTSYSELEKELGRKGNEIGELRKLTDKLLDLGVPNNTNKSEANEDDGDFYDDPESYVEKKVSKRVKAIEDDLNKSKREAAFESFQKKHPDYNEIGADEDFQDWIRASKFRTEQFAKADTEFDFDAADDLLTTYKEMKELKEQSTDTEARKQRREKDLKKATTQSSSTASAGKKIYKRAELIRLRVEDPAKYEMMQPEIMEAYAEGRIK